MKIRHYGISIENPEMSVIMPTFNRGYIIHRALNSIKNQTYKNFELIVVNDGSNDDTEKIISTYVDIPILYMEYSSNQGANVARNLGMRHARGKFFSFLDSDNEYETDSLEERVKALDDGNDIVFGKFLILNKKLRMLYPEINNSIELDNLIRMELKKNIMDTNATSISRKCYEIEGGFGEHQKRLQDWEYFFRLIYEKKYKVKFINKKLSNIYVLKDSITNKQELLFDSRYEIFLKQMDWCRKYEIMNEVIYDMTLGDYRSDHYSKKKLVEKFVPVLDEVEFEIFLQHLESVYLFPYHLFHKGEKVIIYGAGKAGIEFYQIAKKYNYIKIVAIIDQKPMKRKDIIVDGIDRVKKYEFDSILISFCDKNTAIQAKDALMLRGIEKSLIKWDGEIYMQDGFWNRYIECLNRLTIGSS